MRHTVFYPGGVLKYVIGSLHFLLQRDVLGTKDCCCLSMKEMKASELQAFTAGSYPLPTLTVPKAKQ